MKKRQLQLAVMTLFALTCAAGCTPGRGPLGGPPRPPGKQEQMRRFIECFREEFKPTDAQLDYLKTKVLKDDSSTRELEVQLKTTRQELDAGFTSGMPEAEVLAKFTAMSELERKLAESHFKRMLGLRSILTVEQRAHFATCRKRLGPPQPGPGPDEGPGPDGPGPGPGEEPGA